MHAEVLERLRAACFVQPRAHVCAYMARAWHAYELVKASDKQFTNRHRRFHRREALPLQQSAKTSVA